MHPFILFLSFLPHPAALLTKPPVTPETEAGNSWLLGNPVSLATPSCCHGFHD